MGALEHKFALVTGGNRGIGLEVCRKLVEKGKPVILTSRDAAAGTQRFGATIVSPATPLDT